MVQFKSWPPKRAYTLGYFRRARVHSVLAFQSGGSGKSSYSAASNCRKGAWAYKPTQRPSPAAAHSNAERKRIGVELLTGYHGAAAELCQQRPAPDQSGPARGPLAGLFVVGFVVGLTLAAPFMFPGAAMMVNRDTSVSGAADQLPHGGAAGSGGRILVAQRNSGGRRSVGLGNENQAAFGIGRHRMGAGGNRNGLYEDAGGIDYSEHRPSAQRRTGRLDGAAGAGVIALVAAVEPDFVGTGDVTHLRVIVGGRVDHQSGGAAGQVSRRAAEQKIIVHANSSAIRPARIERNDSGVLDRVIGAFDAGRRMRIGYQQAAAAGNGAGQLAVVAAGRVVGNDGDRGVEALGFRIPGRLLDSEAKAGGQNRGIDSDLHEWRDGAGSGVAIRRKQRDKRRIIRIIGGDQKLAIRSERHFVDAEGTTGVEHLLGFAAGSGFEIDDVQRAVPVAGIEPAAMCRNAGGAGRGIIYAALAGEHDSLKRLIEPCGADEFQQARVDDVDALGGAVTQVVFPSLRIHKADIKGRQPASGDGNRGQALGFGIGGSAWTRAGRGAGRRDRCESEQRGREHLQSDRIESLHGNLLTRYPR